MHIQALRAKRFNVEAATGTPGPLSKAEETSTKLGAVSIKEEKLRQAKRAERFGIITADTVRIYQNTH